MTIQSNQIDNRTSPVLAIKLPANRQQRRPLEREIESLLPDFIALEKMFLDDLYSDEYDDLNYGTLFRYYQHKFNILCDRIERKRKLKYTEINRDYWAEMYHPIERAPGKAPWIRIPSTNISVLPSSILIGIRGYDVMEISEEAIREGKLTTTTTNKSQN